MQKRKSLLMLKMKSNQNYTKKDISPFFRVNGYPPKSEEYEKLKANDFKDWILSVYGLVDNPIEMSLQDIKDLRKQDQITKQANRHLGYVKQLRDAIDQERKNRG